ncbi:MAG: efflux RND transporter permease subunit [Methylophilaceae bacterium]
MTLPELSIKRHVFAWMISFIFILFGYIGYQKIGVDRFPMIEFPVLSITTTLEGANPEVIDSSITNLIETAVNTVTGIESIKSQSSPGVSVVTITFELSKDIEVAFNEVQSKVSQLNRRLPEEIVPPVVRKVETNASPIMWLGLTGDRTIQQLNLYANNILKKKIETIDGVGEVTLGGRRDRTVRVNLDLEKMVALNITADDLKSAFKKEHIQLPGGYLVRNQSEKMFKLDLEFHKVQELQNLVVGFRDKTNIKLKDISDIEDGLTDYRQIARYNYNPSIGLGIIKVANSNTVEIIDKVKKKIDEEIRPNLPPGLNIDISTDDSIFIKEMIKSLIDHILEGTLLAALVVFIFLQSIRSTLIISMAIPISLFGSIAVMYFLGYTFNSMTLLALILLIGVVVDDAIVVLENIFRHQDIEKNNTEAAIKGSREVVFAVIASSLALVSIFAPVIYMDGIIGKFFESFAVVVTVGILVSLIVSLTLTPMLCSRYLKREKKSKQQYLKFLNVFFNNLENNYRLFLKWVLVHRIKILLITLLIVLSSGFFFKQAKKEFVPETDESRFTVTFKTPLGSNMDYTVQKLIEIESVIAKYDSYIESVFSSVGLGSRGQVNRGYISIRLKEKNNRDKSQTEIMDLLKKDLATLSGVKAFPAGVSIASGNRSEKLQFSLIGPGIENVSLLADKLNTKLSEIEGMGNIDLDLQLNLPQMTLDIDREKAASFGISAEQIAESVSILSNGFNVAKYNDEPGDGQRYEIRLKAKEGSFNSIQDLNKIYIRSKTGELVRIDNFTQFKETLGPAIIAREELQYAANFYTNPDIPLGEAMNKIKNISNQIIPSEYSINYSGQAREFGKTFSNIIFIFSLATVLLYMVLSSLFNSFYQPLIVMLAQPLAIIGGVFLLWLTGNSLNIYSMIGLVLLVGLVAKNSILLVDLTNQFVSQGNKIDEALIKACPVRLRPVLMTSLTLILALLPAAFGVGAGSEENGPLSVAIIGGMISSTLLTLVVIPAAYSLSYDLIKKIKL